MNILHRACLIAALVLSVTGCASKKDPSQVTTVAPSEINMTASLPAPVLATIEKIQKEHGVRVGVSYEPVTVHGLPFSYRGNELFHAASTMKVPVMIEVFRRADAGDWNVEDELIVRQNFSSVIDGSEYEATPRQYLRERLDTPDTIYNLTEQMIIVSDNAATNMLIELCGAENITATMRKLGAEKSVVLRGLMDIKAFDAGYSNMMTPIDLTKLMLAIEVGAAATRESCEEMKLIMQRQQYTTAIPAGVPATAKVANKTGSITSVYHDTAIVDAIGGTYVLTVLIDGIPSGVSGSSLVAEISRSIYETIFSEKIAASNRN